MRKVLAFVFALTACGPKDSSTELKTDRSSLSQEEELPYNLLKQKSVHNAYQRKESLEEMYEAYGLRSMELDIHTSKVFRPGISRDWYVYHEWFDLASKVDTFSDGLKRIAALSRDDQDPISLFVDLKSKFDLKDHRFEDLDQLLSTTLGNKIYSPADIIARCPDAQQMAEAIDRCGWPLRSELRGRILVILTGGEGNLYAPNSELAAQRLAFVAPSITKESEIEEQAHAIFFNLSKSTVFESSLAETIFNRGKVIRSWDLNSEKDWKKALLKPIAQLATNKVNTKTDPWAIIPDLFSQK